MDKICYYFYVRDVTSRELYTWHEYLEYTPSFGMKFKDRTVRDVMMDSTGHVSPSRFWESIRVTDVEVFQYAGRNDVIKIFGEGF